MSALNAARRAIRWSLVVLIVSTSACSGGDTRPGTTAPVPTPTPTPTPTVTPGSFEVKLNGATSAHAAAVMDLTGIPDGSTVTPGAGVTVYSRARSGQGLMLLLSGDLTGNAVVRLITPTSTGVSPRGTVHEVSTSNGALVDGALPSVIVTAVSK